MMGSTNLIDSLSNLSSINVQYALYIGKFSKLYFGFDSYFSPIIPCLTYNSIMKWTTCKIIFMLTK